MNILLIIFSLLFYDSNMGHSSIFMSEEVNILAAEAQDEERFILRVRNREGEVINSAWVSLQVETVESSGLSAPPPVFYEYTIERNGIYILLLNPGRLTDKKFMLNVHAEGYRQYRLNFSRLNRDITVTLER